MVQRSKKALEAEAKAGGRARGVTAGTPRSEEGTGVARGSPDPRGYLWRSIVGSLNTRPGSPEASADVGRSGCRPTASRGRRAGGDELVTLVCSAWPVVSWLLTAPCLPEVTVTATAMGSPSSAPGQTRTSPARVFPVHGT